MESTANKKQAHRSLVVHSVSTRGSDENEQIVINPINVNESIPKTQRRFTTNIESMCNAITLVHLNSKKTSIGRDARNFRMRLLAVANTGLRHARRPSAVTTAKSQLAALTCELIRQADGEFQFPAKLAVFRGLVYLLSAIGGLALMTQGLPSIAAGLTPGADLAMTALLLLAVFSCVFSVIRVLIYTYHSSTALNLGMLQEMIEISPAKHAVRTAILGMLAVVVFAGIIRGIPLIANFLPPAFLNSELTQWSHTAALYYGLILGVLIGFFDKYLFNAWRKTLSVAVGKNINDSSN